MKFLLLISAVLLSMPPAIANVEPRAGDVFKLKCMGDEKMNDKACREQKSKYCDCIAGFVYERQVDKPYWGSDRNLQRILPAIELARRRMMLSSSIRCFC